MKKLLLFVSAIFVCQFVQAQSPQMIEGFKESYTLEANGNYKDAVTKIKSVYETDSYEANLRLGWLTYSAGAFDESVAYYENCLDLRPLSIEARLGIINPLTVLGKWDKILATYNKALEINPQNSTLNYRTGYIYYVREDYPSAEKHFEKVVNFYPFDYSGLLMLGWTKYFLGKSGEAKVLFNRVLLYSPEDASAMEGLGLIK